MPQGPQIVVLDWDDTLAFVKIDAREEISVEKDVLSDSPLSTIKTPVIKKRRMNDEIEYQVESIKALWRRGFKENLFDPAYEIIQDAKKNNVEPTIKIVILTSSSYTEKDIKERLDQFYATDEKNGCDKRFSTNRFPVEIYTHKDIPVIGKKFFKTKPEYRARFLDTKDLPEVAEEREKKFRKGNVGRTYDSKKKETNKESLIEDPSKALLMTNLYDKKWVNEMPGLVKKNVHFIDNMDANRHGVIAAGFDGDLVYPSTPKYTFDESTKMKDALPVLKEGLQNIIANAKGELEKVKQSVTTTTSITSNLKK